MREFNLLEEYPSPEKPRYVGSDLRTINHRIVATLRDKDFFDGNRNYGYGGFKYDGRWKKIAKKIANEYNLDNKSSFLQLGCEKGFLLHDLKNILPNLKIRGLETSDYAVNNSMEDVRKYISKTKNYINLEYEENKFDFILALGVVYTLNLSDAIQCLKEIQRISKGKSFVILASYETIQDYWLFRQWTVLGSTILLKNDWIEVLNHVNYTGDYYFTSAKSLSLKRK